MLAQAFNQKLLLAVYQGIVDGSSTQIHSGDNLHASLRFPILNISHSLTASRNCRSTGLLRPGVRPVGRLGQRKEALPRR